MHGEWCYCPNRCSTPGPGENRCSTDPSCAQSCLKEVASSVVPHGLAGTGGRQRKSPTGGAAYGIERKKRVGGCDAVSTTPCTEPTPGSATVSGSMLTPTPRATTPCPSTTVRDSRVLTHFSMAVGVVPLFPYTQLQLSSGLQTPVGFRLLFEISFKVGLPKHFHEFCPSRSSTVSNVNPQQIQRFSLALPCPPAATHH